MLWFVGNEMTAWQGFICEDSYAERFPTSDKCQLERGGRSEVIDDLCEVVHKRCCARRLLRACLLQSLQRPRFSRLRRLLSQWLDLQARRHICPDGTIRV